MMLIGIYWMLDLEFSICYLGSSCQVKVIHLNLRHARLHWEGNLEA